MKRTIRNKEWGINLITKKSPGKNQLEQSLSTLKNREYDLRTDKNGFIIYDGYSERIESDKIIVLGDSFVESLFVDEKKRFCAQMDLASDNNYLNGGYSGATSLHLFNSFVNKVLPLKPKEVIFFVPTNDERVLELQGAYWCSDKRLGNFTALTKSLDLPDLDFNFSGDEFEPLKLLLSATNHICCLFGIKLSIATTPHRDITQANDAWVSKNQHRINIINKRFIRRKLLFNKVREYSHELDIDVIDLEGFISLNNNFFYDDLHLNLDGSLAVSNYLISGNINE